MKQRTGQALTLERRNDKYGFLPDINDKNAGLSCRTPASGLTSSRKKYRRIQTKYAFAGVGKRSKKDNKEELSVGVLMATSSPVKKSVALRQNILLQFH